MNIAVWRLSIVGTTIQTMLIVADHLQRASKNLLDLTWSIAQQLMSVNKIVIVQKDSTPDVVDGLFPIALILPVPTMEGYVNLTMASNTLKDPQELLVVQCYTC